MNRQTKRDMQMFGDKMAFLNLALLPTSENLPPFMGLNVVVSGFGGEKKSNAILVTFEFLSTLCFFLPIYCVTSKKLCHGIKSVCRVDPGVAGLTVYQSLQCSLPSSQFSPLCPSAF